MDSDLEVPTELIAIRASAEVNGSTALNDFFLADDAVEIPFSFVVAPPEGADEEAVSITLVPRGPQDELFTRRAETSFRKHQRVRLPLFLAKQCLSQPVCTAGETCSEDGCVTTTIAPDTLVEIEPGQELGAAG